ncbi:MAG TPA: hypothetical protein VIS96_10905 [Terrimicrobiaceae bacterium]
MNKAFLACIIVYAAGLLARSPTPDDDCNVTIVQFTTSLSLQDHAT